MSKKILVVDDEPIVVEIARRKLAEAGHDVVTANNGEQAIESIKGQIPDLVLLDVEMPVMNGYTCLQNIRKIPGAEKLPVIVLTSHENMGPIMSRHGLKGYLKKPLDLPELFMKIQEVFGEE